MTHSPLYSIEAAQIAHEHGRAPRSLDFDDDYFHPRDGLAETRYVFLEGVGISELFQRRETVCIAETGFGTGLNFLATLNAWRRYRDANLAAGKAVARLDYVSLEGRPLSLTQCRPAWQVWQAELGAEIQALGQVLPPACPGFHLVTLEGGQVRLLLLYGQAHQVLPEADFKAQAWFLDGFSPARNADLWSPEVFQQIARLSAPGARLATFSVARKVKDGLADIGAEWSLRPGFQGKRNCLRARLPGDHVRRAALQSPGCLPDWQQKPPQSLTIVGAGLAGAAAAHCLKLAGFDMIRVIEAEPAAAMHASGNPLGIVEPRLSHALAPEIELQRLAFIHAVLAYQQAGIFVEPRGMLKVARDAATASKMTLWLRSGLLPSDWMQEAGPGQLWFPTSGGVCPPELVQGWLADIEVETGRRWRPSATNDGPDAGGLKLLAGGALSRLALTAEQDAKLGPALGANKGQLMTRASDERLQRFVSKSGYLLDDGQRWIAGSSFKRFAVEPAAREAILTQRAWAQEEAEESEALRQRLADLDPETAARSGWRFERAALRSVTRDRNPVLGPLPPDVPSQSPLFGANWIFAGLGSRGLSLAPLLAHELRAQLLGDMHVLPASLRRLIDPHRFWRAT